MEALFSPTRSMATEMTENTPVENTARALFKEPEMNTTATPLGTITNTQTNLPQDEAEGQKKVLSPSLQNVTQLKNWITKMEKENKEKSNSAWKKPASINRKVTRTKQTTGRVHEMREKIAERKLIPKTTNSIVKTPAPASRSVKIPMNKVQQMRQILLDFKNTQAKQSEQIHMSSKKRAKIAERLNRVQDIQKWLNEMEHQSRKIAVRNDASAPKTKELNLPMNRVREMKNWLIEFERQNKEHSNRFTGKANNSGSLQERAGIPGTRGPQRSSIGTNTIGNEVAATTAERQMETPSKTAVSELAQFLVDFEKKNKEHYEKSQRKSGTNNISCLEERNEENNMNESKQVIEDESTFDPFLIENSGTTSEEEQEDEYETEEDKEVTNFGEQEDDQRKEENRVDDFVVLNTSILDNDNSKKDTNTSMIPTLNILEQSQWDDDYDDLMKVDINIEPVQSADSWENESFGYSNQSEKDANGNPGAYKEGEDDTSSLEEEEIDDVSTSRDLELVQNQSYVSQRSIQSSEHSREDDELSESLGKKTDGDDLYGEEILSTSHTGARFSSSFMITNDSSCIDKVEVALVHSEAAACDPHTHSERDKIDQEVQSKVGIKGFGCIYKSLFRVFVPKKNTIMETHEMEDEIEVNHGTKISTSGSINNEIHMKANHEQDKCVGNIIVAVDNQTSHTNDGYLPKTYTKSSDVEEPHDFARAMLLDRATDRFNPNCESPMSLASVFRRSMSPTSSSCAGSEISGVHHLVNGNQKSANVAQHVGWLQGHFHSPKAPVQSTRRGNML